MTHHFNVSGPERKELVKKISGHLGVEAKYLGVPSCAYQIGSYTVAKDGSLSWNDLDDADPAHMEESCSLIQALEAAGFKSDEMTFLAEQQEAIEAEQEEEQPVESSQVEEQEEEADEEEEEEDEDEEEADGITISMPASMFDEATLENLRALIAAKGKLILKALGASNLRIEADAETVNFPWFDRIPEADQVDAYTKFIGALCKMAREAKRVTAKEKPVENEKYAFRCFLLRLGFIGDEYKKARKTLLKNFDGSSAFGTQDAEDKYREKQEAKKAETNQSEEEA